MLSSVVRNLSGFNVTSFRLGGARRLACLAAALCCVGMAPAGAVGRWRGETHGSVINIVRCGGSICGRIVSSDVLTAQPGLQDARNVDTSLRGRPLQNLMILGGFIEQADAWAGGTIYDPENGRTYHARVVAVNADHLLVRGCIVFPVCRSQLWTRIGGR